MSNEALEEELRTFLLEHVHSFEQLELLLLVHAHGAREWSLEELSRELGVSEQQVAPALQHLRAQAILGRSPSDARRYRLTLQTPEIERRLAALAVAQREQRLLLIQTMSANALERLRTSAIRTFAEAFRLRGGPRDRGGGGGTGGENG